MAERTIEEIGREDPGPLIDPGGGPPDEGLIGIYDGDGTGADEGEDEGEGEDSGTED